MVYPKTFNNVPPTTNSASLDSIEDRCMGDLLSIRTMVAVSPFWAVSRGAGEVIVSGPAIVMNMLKRCTIAVSDSGAASTRSAGSQTGLGV